VVCPQSGSQPPQPLRAGTRWVWVPSLSAPPGVEAGGGQSLHRGLVRPEERREGAVRGASWRAARVVDRRRSYRGVAHDARVQEQRGRRATGAYDAVAASPKPPGSSRLLRIVSQLNPTEAREARSLKSGGRWRRTTPSPGKVADGCRGPEAGRRRPAAGRASGEGSTLMEARLEGGRSPLRGPPSSAVAIRWWRRRNLGEAPAVGWRTAHETPSTGEPSPPRSGSGRADARRRCSAARSGSGPGGV
jgi:hypothetical protein